MILCSDKFAGVARNADFTELSCMCRWNGLTVMLFVLPAMALMKIPVLGAAVIFLRPPCCGLII